jgi:hypothetical protein
MLTQAHRRAYPVGMSTTIMIKRMTKTTAPAGRLLVLAR